MQSIPPQGSVSFESRAELSRHYIESTTDPKTSQPYFDVFFDTPIQLVHDWPDFGDLTARYWETSLMIENMTGIAPLPTKQLLENLISYFEEDGLNYRPLTAYSHKSAEMFDQSRTLLALCSGYMHSPNERLAGYMTGLVDALLRISEVRDGYRYFPASAYANGEWKDIKIDWDDCTWFSGYLIGPLIRPLVKVWDLLKYQPALDLALDFTKFVVEHGMAITEDGKFGGHVHGILSTATGIFAAGKATQNSEWIIRAEKAWDYAAFLSGPCGFVPENLSKWDPKLRSETCGIMDFMELTIMLAYNGDQSKWQVAERTLRNHLIESQLIRSDYLDQGIPTQPDELSNGDNALERMIGGFAGWSSFDNLLAITPVQTESWLQSYAPPEIYVNRLRLFQNCCGPAGLKGIFLAWSQSSRMIDGVLNVNMLVNRSLPQACVTVSEQSSGRLLVTVTVKQKLDACVRVPDWAAVEEITVLKNGRGVEWSVEGGRIFVAGLNPQDKLTLDMPLVTTNCEYTVQEIAYTPEVFGIRLKGDSAIKVEHLSGGLSPEEKRKESKFHDVYPLYERKASDVYAAESQTREASVSIEWF